MQKVKDQLIFIQLFSALAGRITGDGKKKQQPASRYGEWKPHAHVDSMHIKQFDDEIANFCSYKHRPTHALCSMCMNVC